MCVPIKLASGIRPLQHCYYSHGMQRVVVHSSAVEQVHLLLRVVRRLEARDALVGASGSERLVHVHGEPEESREDLAERARVHARAHAVRHRVGEEACAVCIHGLRLRLARRTAISMAPPQQPAPRIRAAYVAGGRRLSHFTHARSGSPLMSASG